MKKLLSVLIAFVFVVSIIPTVTMQKAKAANGIQNKINEVLAVYSNGSYFTAASSTSPCSSSNHDTINGVWCQGCYLPNIPARGGLPSGSSVGFSADTCCGFATYVFYCIYGHHYKTNTTKTSSPVFGDLVHTGTHYFIYLSEDSSNYYVYDANGYGGAKNMVKYNNYYPKSAVSSLSVYHANNYDAINNDYSTSYYFDVNVNADGEYLANGHNNVTFDVYIGGSKVKDDVKDFSGTYSGGTSYTVNDIKVSGCYANNGSSSYSGTINSAVNIVIPIVTSHSWNGGTVTTQPTYLTSGVKSYSCTNCSAAKTESIDRLALPSSPESVASVESDGHTYTLYAANMNWTAAKNWCESNGGHLVTITSAEEQTVVSGLIGNYSESSFWFGAENKTTGSYCWVTGEEWNYTSWAEGEPNNDGTGENYLGSAYHNTGWNDFSETASNVRGFILENENSHVTHTWDEGVITLKATCTAPGTKLFTCTECGATKTESYTVTGGTGTWSAWSEEEPPAGAYQTESKQQYSFSDKETTSSSSSSLSGWTQYDSAVTSWGSWSNWQNSAVTASATRQVETRYIEPTYKTVWHYSRSIEGKWSGAYSSYSLTYWPTVQYITLDYQLSRMSQYDADGHACYGRYYYEDYSTSLWWNERSERVVNQPGYTQYRYRDGNVTYYFYRWTAFSDWSDTVYTANDNRQVNTRTVYRYIMDAPVADHTWDDGVVTIEPTATTAGEMLYTCTVCSATKVEEIPPIEPEYVAGDINGDGNVNNKDLTRLMKYLAGENVTVTEAALDVNGDGNVNNKDLTRLMKYLAGEDVEIYRN